MEEEGKRTNSEVNEKSMQPFPEQRKKTVYDFPLERERQRETSFDLFPSHSSSSLLGVYISTRQGRLPLSPLLAQLTLDQPRRNFVSCCANHGIKLSINWKDFKVAKISRRNFRKWYISSFLPKREIFSRKKKINIIDEQ